MLNHTLRMSKNINMNYYIDHSNCVNNLLTNINKKKCKNVFVIVNVEINTLGYNGVKGAFDIFNLNH